MGAEWCLSKATATDIVDKMTGIQSWTIGGSV